MSSGVPVSGSVLDVSGGHSAVAAPRESSVNSASAAEIGAAVVDTPKQGQPQGQRANEPIDIGLDSGAQDTLSSSTDPAADRADEQTAAGSPAADASPSVADIVQEARARLYGQPQRDEATGQYMPANLGHSGALANSEQFARIVEPARRELAAEILTDCGQAPATAPRLLRSAADDAAKLELLSESFWQLVIDRGVTTTKGRTTAAVRQLLGVLDRKMAIYKLLGLERKAKPANRLQDYLAGIADDERPAGAGGQHAE